MFNIENIEYDNVPFDHWIIDDFLDIEDAKKLSDELKKDRFSITMNNEVSKIAKTYQPNMSKYIERLVYNDLRKNNMIEKIELL